MFILKSERGFNLTSLLVAMGMSAAAVLIASQLLIGASKMANYSVIYNSIELKKNDMLKILTQDYASWEKTKEDPLNTSMECLRLKTSCCEDPDAEVCVPIRGMFRIHQFVQEGVTWVDKIYYDAMPATDTHPDDFSRKGFTLNGADCNEFDAVNGNDKCPFRIEPYWRAICEYPCVSPQIKFDFKLLVKPKTEGILPTMNWSTQGINMMRGKVSSTSSMAFTSSNVFDVITTAGGGYVQDFDFYAGGSTSYILVEAWGGGGAGAGGIVVTMTPNAATTPELFGYVTVAGGQVNVYPLVPKTVLYLAGGGGGGGAYVKSVYNIAPGSRIRVHVGLGGRALIGGAGGDGSSSYVGVPGAVVATGGKGGKRCSQVELNVANQYVCVDPQGQGGDGGVISTTVPDVAISDGKNGGDYNQVFGSWYTPETGIDALNDFWTIVFFGGDGGSAGGGGGQGATNDRLNSGTLPTLPGGGGAGRMGVSGGVALPISAHGAHGRVIIWE